MIQALETRQMLSSGPIGFNDPVLVIPALAVEYHVKVAIDRVSYYDLTGLAPGMHSLHIEQAAGLITTIQFQR